MQGSLRGRRMNDALPPDARTARLVRARRSMAVVRYGSWRRQVGGRLVMRGEIRRFMASIGASVLVLLGACSSGQIYHGLQQNLAQQCRELPGIQQERCLARYSERYTEYAERRADALEER